MNEIVHYIYSFGMQKSDLFFLCGRSLLCLLLLLLGCRLFVFETKFYFIALTDLEFTI